MKIAIMQPYIFPYIGYFQLLHAVDTFVFFDDVQYKRRSYITRNATLVNSKSKTFSIPTVKNKREAAINEIELHESEFLNWRNKFLKSLEHTYAKAPHFEQVFSFIESVLTVKEPNLSALVEESIRKTADYLGINSTFKKSSQLSYNRKGDGQDKIISLCRLLEANTYINAINGRKLYDKQVFEQENIRLAFVEPHIKSYPQFDEAFVSHLSIIDLMMFLAPGEIKEHLEHYNLLT